MRSRGTKEFWALYHALSRDARRQARKALESPAVAPHPLRLLFAENPEHPSLRFKKLHGAHPYWSVRFGSGYRAVCRREGDKADWIWIGTHQDFDKAI